uniref:Uncharacterized protein n=1 Tax=Knipowitschia caucasica TaxID=637954 RepID=A0AAV2LE19_KNICA
MHLVQTQARLRPESDRSGSFQLRIGRSLKLTRPKTRVCESRPCQVTGPCRRGNGREAIYSIGQSATALGALWSGGDGPATLKEDKPGRLNQVDKPGGQTRRTNQVDKPGGQTRWTKPGGQTRWTNQVDKPGGQTRRTNQVDKPGGQTRWTNQVD